MMKREAALKAECAALVDAAVEEYLQTPKQSTDAMFDYVFARLPKNISRAARVRAPLRRQQRPLTSGIRRWQK